MVRGIVFDLDGTLVDSLADIAASVNAVLRRHGRDGHETQDYRGFIGRGLGVLVRRAFGVADDAQGPQIDARIEEARRIYDAHCLDATAPYEGIPGLLDELKRRGIAMSVVSNKPDAMTQRVVARLFADGTFTAVTGERHGLPRKPDPAALLRAASFMGLDPARCLMIGDSPVDIAAGQRAPMRTVAVTWGNGGEDELRAASPSFVAHRPVDILDALR